MAGVVIDMSPWKEAGKLLLQKYKIRIMHFENLIT